MSIVSNKGITVCTCYQNFIVQCGAPQTVPGWGESSWFDGGPGVGGGEEKFRAVQQARVTGTTGHQVHLQVMIIINHDNINHDNTVQLGTSQKVSARMDAAGNEVNLQIIQRTQMIDTGIYRNLIMCYVLCVM